MCDPGIKLAQVGDKQGPYRVELLEGVGDVLQEYDAYDNVLVLGGLSEPDFEAEVGERGYDGVSLCCLFPVACVWSPPKTMLSLVTHLATMHAGWCNSGPALASGPCHP